MHFKYIKLVILEILFILRLCNFKFSFKIPWPPSKNNYSLVINLLLTIAVFRKSPIELVIAKN